MNRSTCITCVVGVHTGSADATSRRTELGTLTDIATWRTWHRNRSSARMALFIVLFQQIILVRWRRRRSTRKLGRIVLRLISWRREFGSSGFRTGSSLSHCSCSLYCLEVFLSQSIRYSLQNTSRSPHFDDFIQFPLLTPFYSQQHRRY